MEQVFYALGIMAALFAVSVFCGLCLAVFCKDHESCKPEESGE